MDNAIIDNWYEDDQFANQYAQPYQKEQIENRWRIFESMVKEHGFRQKELKVLDLGCGDGINILGIKEILDRLGYSYHIKGTDFNESRLKKVRHRFPDVDVEVFDIVQDTQRGLYDLVIFNHVLEHIPEDGKALEKLASLTHQDSLIILGVPNEGCIIAFLRNHLFQRKILKYTDHVHFYTEKTLVEKIERAGLKAKQVEREGFFMPHCRLTDTLKKYIFGRKLLKMLKTIMPSQAAGLIVKVVKQ